MGESQEDRKTLSNKVDEDLKERFDLAVQTSELNQQEALEGMMAFCVEKLEEEGTIPDLKPEVSEAFEDYHE